MHKSIHIAFLIFLFSTSFLNPAFTTDFVVGQSVILKATKSKGVPIHREPTPSYWKHVPNKTTATIHEITEDGRWLSIELESGETGWVVSKYIRSTSRKLNRSQKSTSTIPTMDIADDEEAVWSSREECEHVVNEGRRMDTSVPSALRLTTWNLRWFPNGQPKDQHEDFAEPTDLKWLICTIIWMQVDVLAIQESLATPAANTAWNTITQSLSKKTGDTWRWHRQPCGRPDDHHIGLLWNDTRVSLSQFESLWQFNAKAKSTNNACTFGLRPGQYARVQSRDKNGADFHLIALHLKSGPTVFAVEERHKALNRIDQAVKPLLKQDQDIVILGDFNTMGAGDWHSRNSELKYVRRLVSKEKPGFEDLSLTPQCTQYFRGRGGWLDHVLIAKGMKEVTVRSAQVTGYCAVADCQRIKGDYPLAYRRLSDHCPVIVEITNRDED